jgi:dihydrodipicolinate synthase/N-acetylneuraminate lyase
MTIQTKRFRGIIPPVSTPFNSNEEIDYGGLTSLIDFLIGAGVHALWMGGSTGEFSSLAIEEREETYRRSIKQAKGKVPVVVTASHSSTKVSVELARFAEEAGADAVAATPPYYFHFSPSSLFEHYKAVSKSVDIPVVIYDNPQTTHQVLSVDLISSMARKLGIHTIKIVGYPDQTPLEKAIKLKKLLGDDINVIIATAQFAYDSLSMGVAEGVISALLNVIPHEFVKMYEAIQSGDIKTAQEIHYTKILPLAFSTFDTSKEETVYPQVIKMILKWRHVISHENVRKPLSPLSDWQVKSLRSMAEHTGII